MIDYVKEITSLCKYLPKSDQVFADKFIKTRDFVSLREIIYSDIMKIHIESTKASPNLEIISLDEDKLSKLLVIVEKYLDLIGDEYMDDYNDNESEYEFSTLEEDEW